MIIVKQNILTEYLRHLQESYVLSNCQDIGREKKHVKHASNSLKTLRCISQELLCYTWFAKENKIAVGFTVLGKDIDLTYLSTRK